jgi:hypothetical protein
LKVVASQNIGSLGPRDGPVVRVNCPVGDSLRSVVGWFVVVLLLLLRKANRVKEAWALLVPLAVLYLALGVVERPLNAYLVFHYHQYICSILADLFRYFALSVAILLACADRLDIPWRPVRFILVFLLLGLCADVQIALNGWPVMDSGRWAVVFAVMLLVFMVGHSLVHAVLRRCFKPARFRWWYSGFCLVFGLAPMLALGAVEVHLSRSTQLSSTLEQYRIVVVLASAISLPYLLFYAFILLALRSPLYCKRFVRAFGVTSLAPQPIVKQPESAPIAIEARIP